MPIVEWMSIVRVARGSTCESYGECGADYSYSFGDCGDLQNDRSQIKNKATAMRTLKSRLYEKQEDEKRSEMEKFYGAKGEIAWGNQIRSCVSAISDGEGFTHFGGIGQCTGGDGWRFKCFHSCLVTGRGADFKAVGRNHFFFLLFGYE